MTKPHLMRLLNGRSLRSVVAHNQAIGFEGILRNAELFVEIGANSRAVFVNVESAELEQEVLNSLGDRLTKLRAVLGPRLEEYATLLWLLENETPFEEVLETAKHDSQISAAEFMDGITWLDRHTKG